MKTTRFLALALVAPALHAATWDGSETPDLNWSTVANWSDNASPANKAILFNNTGAATIGTVTSVVDQSNSVASLTFTNQDSTAPRDDGHTVQLASTRTLTVNGLLRVGTYPGFSANDLRTNVEFRGGGDLIINGALEVYNGGSSSDYAILDLSRLNSLTVNAGANSIRVGYNNQARGDLTLAPTSSLTAASIAVGDYSNSAPRVSYLRLGEATVFKADSLIVGRNRLNGEVLLQSGLSTPTFSLRNRAGDGRASVWIGDGGSSNQDNYGTVDLRGATVDLLISSLNLGIWNKNNQYNATGSFYMDRGVVDATTVSLGRLTAAATTATTQGRLFVQGGNFIAETITLADNTGGGTDKVTGRLDLATGTLRAASIQRGSGNGTAQFNWSSGTIANRAGGDLTIGAGVPLTLLTAANHTFAADAGRTITVASNILGGAGVGDLVKTGDGALLLKGTVGSLANPVPVTVNAGTLGGSGTVYGNVSIADGAALAPGNSPDQLFVVGDLTLAAGADYMVEIVTGSQPGNGATGYDQTVVTGGVSLDGTNLLVEANLFGLVRGQQLTIVANDGADPVLGTFAGLPEGAAVLVGGVPYFTISYLGLDGATGNDVVLTSLVPEPSSLALLALAGLALHRRRH